MLRLIVQMQLKLCYEALISAFAKKPHTEINIYNKEDIPSEPFKLIVKKEI